MPALPIVVAGGAAAAGLTLLPLRGLPRTGEVKLGSRPIGDAIFHAGLGLLSISLLVLGGSARSLIAVIEPFASSPLLLELASAVAIVLAVTPLLALSVAAPAPDGAASRGRATAQALLRFGIALVPFLALQAATIAAFRELGEPVRAQARLLDYSEADLAVRLAIALGAVVASPIAEEAVFRGTLQPAVARLVGPAGSRVGTAVLFGAMHDGLAIVPMIVFGWFLARLRDAHGRLLPCVAVHAANNAVALLAFDLPFVRDLYALPLAR